MEKKSPAVFAYILERYPTLTQTFVVREIEALRQKNIRPVIFSTRDEREQIPSGHFATEIFADVVYLPQRQQLSKFVVAQKSAGKLPQDAILLLRHWGERGDKKRLYEAIWILLFLQKNHPQVRHLHCHFAGIAARVCWWLRRLGDFSYSITAHASDIQSREQVRPSFIELCDSAAFVATVSKFMVADLQAKLPQFQRKFHCVYNGLEAEYFALVKPKLAGENIFTIVAIGRLIAKKGFAVLLDAAAILRDKIDDGKDFSLKIIGSGPLQQKLSAQIQRLDLSAQVELVGACSQQQILQIFAHSDIFALACVIDENGEMDNLPTVIMEAMARGLPCVSTDIAGIAEMIDDNKDGFLVAPNNAEILADKIFTLMADPQLRQKMGAQARQNALKKFSASETSTKLLQLISCYGGVNFASKINAPSIKWWQKLIIATTRFGREKIYDLHRRFSKHKPEMYRQDDNFFRNYKGL